MLATQVSIGRFHHFHLARQLEKHHLLKAIYTGYPRFKLKDETGIAEEKIHTFPWLHTPYMAIGMVGLNRLSWLDRDLAWYGQDTLDHYVASRLREPTTLIALSGSGLHAGRQAQDLGGKHICDRGSSHICVQDQLLADEYQRYGHKWPGIDPRLIDKEQAEYQQADRISIPSQFCFDSFLQHGISAEKLIKIPYGARLERFKRVQSDASDDDAFIVLFVGEAGARKGFIDLLHAFQLFQHPRKRLVLIGSISHIAKDLLNAAAFSSFIEVLGAVPNAQLKKHYSRATVFVLPSIEEGFAMVIGEAMACGCPVIASTNTGAAEIITDGIDGFIVSIRSPHSIADRLQLLADDPELRRRMGRSAESRVKQLGGWDAYGDAWKNFLTTKMSRQA